LPGPVDPWWGSPVPSRCRPLVGSGWGVGSGALRGCRGVLVESCIVAASIFVVKHAHPGRVCVVKLPRAHGGCLGTRRR
jgi:hypothetical protein